MTQTPTPRFVPRPDPPAAGTWEYKRWAKEASLSYAGGSITSAYGNLAQTFNEVNLQAVCSPTEKQVSVTSATVTNTIGGATSQRAGYTYTKKQYNKTNSSQAAAGEPIRIVTDIGEYEARLTGSMQALATWLCDNGSALFGTIYVYSPRGAAYGPYNAITA